MRHYFFEMGPGNTVAFFEVKGAETFAKPAGGPSDRAIQLDHISFDVPDEHALEMLRKRLLAAGSEVTTVVDHGFIRSIYFTDPNGIALEASWWVVDGTGRPTDFTDEALFGDPNPVPAIAELKAGGIQRAPADPPDLTPALRNRRHQTRLWAGLVTPVRLGDSRRGARSRVRANTRVTARVATPPIARP